MVTKGLFLNRLHGISKSLGLFLLVWIGPLLSGCIQSENSGQDLVEVRYEVTWIGKNTGPDTMNVPVGINNKGQIIGYSGDRLVENLFVWEDGKWTNLPASDSSRRLRDIRSINDDGLIIGYESDIRITKGVIWENNIPRDLPTSPVSNHFYPQSINNNNLITGYYKNSLGKRITCFWPALDSIPTGLELGPLKISSMFVVNNKSLMVGRVQTDKFTFKAASVKDSTLTVLGSMFPDSIPSVSVAEGLNSGGDAVGNSYYKDTVYAFLWKDGQINRLPDLGGGIFITRAHDISDGGVIVGEDYNEKGQRAVLWEKDEIIDLNQYVKLGKGHRLRKATAINEKGQITGVGTGPNSWKETYLLTPIK